MRRIVAVLWVGLVGVLTACTQEDVLIPAAELAGTFDLALVDNDGPGEAPALLFVTSTDRDELRVLELAEDAEERDFIRAPNPLEPLAIPVLDRPQALARDVLYLEGQERTGQYVYVRSNGSSEISVVASSRDLLREVARLRTAGTVTAFAGRGNVDGSSTLYYATQSATGGELWRVELPEPRALLADPTLLVPVSLGVITGEAVSALLVMPEPGRIAVGSRGAGGRTGQAFTLDVNSGSRTPLQFGAPVLQLVTHGRVVREATETKPRAELAAGERIFGILDPASCGGQPQCTGVLAVDATTGAVALDVTGFPMLPIGSGPGLPMGLTLAPQTDILLQTGGQRTLTTVTLLGIVPLSSGRILFFDAIELRIFDVDNYTGADPAGPQLAEARVTLLTAAGQARPTSRLFTEVNHGVTRNTTYQLTYQGLLPGLENESVEASENTAGRILVPARPLGRSIEEVVRPGDVIVLLSGADTPTPTPCPTDLVVAAVEPPAAGGTEAVLVTSTPVPEACVAYTSFQVRAAGSQPFTLFSSLDGYLTRLGVADPRYEIRRPYFYHPDGYAGAADGVALGVGIIAEEQIPLARGDRYVINTVSHVIPFAITVDTSLSSLAFYRLPGSVVHAKVGSVDYAYIAYPSADGILQVNLEAIFADIPNSRAVVPFE